MAVNLDLEMGDDCPHGCQNAELELMAFGAEDGYDSCGCSWCGMPPCWFCENARPTCPECDWVSGTPLDPMETWALLDTAIKDPVAYVGSFVVGFEVEGVRPLDRTQRANVISQVSRLASSAGIEGRAQDEVCDYVIGLWEEAIRAVLEGRARGPRREPYKRYSYMQHRRTV